MMPALLNEIAFRIEQGKSIAFFHVVEGHPELESAFAVAALSRDKDVFEADVSGNFNFRHGFFLLAFLSESCHAFLLAVGFG
jgi:hypothetical protein